MPPGATSIIYVYNIYVFVPFEDMLMYGPFADVCSLSLDKIEFRKIFSNVFCGRTIVVLGREDLFHCEYAPWFQEAQMRSGSVTRGAVRY